MLEIKNVCKSYKTGNFVQHALKNVSIKFRKSEFVSILGQSGSGKTTLLNILGGLDRYDSGDLIINDKSTKKFKDSDWDSYRNACVGFIFQSYNLISHLTVLENVEMCLTLSNGKNKKERALEALKKVGLADHALKKPNQLSGGQMQRVAIARALVNNPDIILADEPTGALDSKTSVQIMELIKEIAKDKLVIMVTHNKELADDYSTRIIELRDGSVLTDSNPLLDGEDVGSVNIRKTKMSFLTALKLSFRNISTKKGRTLLTAFASSIGIIGIALILSLSNGFDKQVDNYEKGIMSAMPVIVSSQAMQLDSDTIDSLSGTSVDSFPSYDYVIPTKSQEEVLTRKNKITDEYISYIEDMPKEYSYGVSYTRYTNVNFLKKNDGVVSLVDNTNTSIASIPKSFDPDDKMAVMEAYYDVLAGRLPKDKSELVLVVDASNRVTDSILDALGLPFDKNVSFDDILSSSIHLVLNNDLYVNNRTYFAMNTNFDDLYDNKSMELVVVGVIRMNEDFPSYVQSSSLCYTEDLMEYILNDSQNSDIVKMQRQVNYNVLTGLPFSESNSEMTKDTMLSYLGDSSTPAMILLYPRDFDSKEKMLKYLDDYNTSLDEEDKIIYTDQAEMISSMSGSIMSAITIVLIAFSSISLVVSSIMIGIITYISVLERTKEIGILRSLGARKKDISRVFNAETFIIGIFSGVLGILIAELLTIPVNMIIYNLTDLSGVAVLNPWHALILITISILLTLIGGAIPSHVASKKDPVIALRTE